MMMMNVVLLSPAIVSGLAVLAADEAEADSEAVTRTMVELREAVTTVVWVIEDRVDASEELAMSAEDSIADGEGDAAAAEASAEGTGAASEVTVSITLSWTTDAACDSWTFGGMSARLIRFSAFEIGLPEQKSQLQV